MEKNRVPVSPAFNIVSWVALMAGVASYLVGLWNAEMQLNERGYYFAVLLLPFCRLLSKNGKRPL